MSFDNYAAYAQDLKGIIREAPMYGSMTDTQRECLDVMASSMANILVNSATSANDWNTISSYSKVGGDQWQTKDATTVKSTSNQRETIPEARVTSTKQR